MISAPSRRQFCALTACAVLSAYTAAYASATTDSADDSRVVITVINNFGPGMRRDGVDQTIEVLRAKLAPRVVHVEEMPRLAADRTALAAQTDLLIAPAEFLAQGTDWSAFHRIATRAMRTEKGLAQTAGTTLIVKRERLDLLTLADLQGKSIAATVPLSLSGWLSLLSEIHNAGFDEHTFFSERHFLQYAIPDIAAAVLNGAVDVGALPVCQLEELIETGFIDGDTLRVINAKPADNVRCLRSTHLYPELVVATTAKTSAEVAKIATVALFTMPAMDRTEWIASGNHADIESLAQTLHLGPYSWLDNLPERLWAEYKYWLVAGAFVLLMMAINERRLQQRLRRMYGELQATLAEQAKTRAEAQAVRERLTAFETRGMVSHLSSMLAHELKQPIAAIMNRSQVIKMRLNEALNDDDESAEAMDGIERSTVRIADIVDRVRSYAKNNDDREVKPCDLRRILTAAIESLLFDNPDSLPVVFKTATNEPMLVNGVALELQVLFLNLLRNAVRAAEQLSVETFVTMTLDKRPAVNGSMHAVVTIVNRSNRIPDDLFDRISECMPGFRSASDGLGLGLSIVHLIADRHGISLTFERVAEGGLVVRADMPLLLASTTSQESHLP